MNEGKRGHVPQPNGQEYDMGADGAKALRSALMNTKVTGDALTAHSLPIN